MLQTAGSRIFLLKKSKKKNLDRKKTTITMTTATTTTLECPKNGTSRRLLRTENLFIIKCDCLEMETHPSTAGRPT